MRVRRVHLLLINFSFADHLDLDAQIRRQGPRGASQRPHRAPVRALQHLRLPGNDVPGRDGVPERQDHAAQDRQQPVCQGIPGERAAQVEAEGQRQRGRRRRRDQTFASRIRAFRKRRRRPLREHKVQTVDDINDDSQASGRLGSLVNVVVHVGPLVDVAGSVLSGRPRLQTLSARVPRQPHDEEARAGG